MREPYDLVVIGTGPAGEKAAVLGAFHGRRVAIVERAPRPGGAMVSDAAVTKAIREAALYLTSFRHRDVYGVGLAVPPKLAVEGVRKRAKQVQELLASAVERNLEQHGIDLVHGTARLSGNGVVGVEMADGTSATLRASAIVVATGSRPFHPPGIPFDGQDVLDATTASRVDRPVGSMVVVGGGAVGCEFASVFAALGTQVTLVESGPALLPFMDADVTARLAEAYAEMGMRLVLGLGRPVVSRDQAGVRVELPSGEPLRPDKVIVAAGTVGNTEELGLQETGVALDDRGRVIVDDDYATSAPGVYAAGDAIGPPALASVSMEQGRAAARKALGIDEPQAVDAATPYGVYSVPETAMIGLTEGAAVGAGEDFVVGLARLSRNARAAISGADRGLVKLIFRRSDRRLLGAHILGYDATDLIHQAQAVMHFGGTIDYFIGAAYNTPTTSEAFKYAAYDALSRLENRETLTASV